jgi:hypothetical protein
VIGDLHSSDSTTKRFTAEEFRKLMRSANLVGAVLFWWEIEKLIAPDWQTRTHLINGGADEGATEMEHAREVLQVLVV